MATAPLGHNMYFRHQAVSHMIGDVKGIPSMTIMALNKHKDMGTRRGNGHAERQLISEVASVSEVREKLSRYGTKEMSDI